MATPPTPTAPDLSPRAAALWNQLKALDRINDATELRLALAQQQLKAAQARAHDTPQDALHRIDRAQHLLPRRAG